MFHAAKIIFETWKDIFDGRKTIAQTTAGAVTTVECRKQGQRSLINTGLQPGGDAGESKNRFNGFSVAGKPLKRLTRRAVFHTRLKPGVNEMKKTAAPFCESEKN